MTTAQPAGARGDTARLDHLGPMGVWELPADQPVGQGVGTSPSSAAEDSRPPL